MCNMIYLWHIFNCITIFCPSEILLILFCFDFQNYDNYISHVKTELNHGVETPERQGSPVRPQIKPQSHAVTKTTERPKSVDRGRLDLDPSNTTSAAPSVPSRNSKG